MPITTGGYSSGNFKLNILIEFIWFILWEGDKRMKIRWLGHLCIEIIVKNHNIFTICQININ